MTIRIKDTDSLDINVAVKDQDTGLAKDISSATTTATFKKNDGLTTVAATISVTSATDGEFTASVATGGLSTGIWQFLAELQIAGKDQVVAEEDILVSGGMS
jgi:uncharacterized protein YjdB